MEAFFESNRHAIEEGIRKYNTVLTRTSETLAGDDTFKKAFSSFYQLKFYKQDPEEAQLKQQYFNLMQQHYIDSSAFNPYLDFQKVLNEMHTFCDKVQMSFASKLLHTIYPQECPIYDSIVGNLHFGISRKNDIKKGSAALMDYYNKYSLFCNSEEAKEIISLFKEAFPASASFSDYKIIDFVLWRDRSEENLLFAKEWISYVIAKQRIKQLEMSIHPYSVSLCKSH